MRGQREIAHTRSGDAHWPRHYRETLWQDGGAGVRGKTTIRTTGGAGMSVWAGGSPFGGLWRGDGPIMARDRKSLRGLAKCGSPRPIKNG